MLIAFFITIISNAGIMMFNSGSFNVMGLLLTGAILSIVSGLAVVLFGLPTFYILKKLEIKSARLFVIIAVTLTLLLSYLVVYSFEQPNSPIPIYDYIETMILSALIALPVSYCFWSIMKKTLKNKII